MKNLFYIGQRRAAPSVFKTWTENPFHTDVSPSGQITYRCDDCVKCKIDVRDEYNIEQSFQPSGYLSMSRFSDDFKINATFNNCGAQGAINKREYEDTNYYYNKRRDFMVAIPKSQNLSIDTVETILRKIDSLFEAGQDMFSGVMTVEQFLKS